MTSASVRAARLSALLGLLAFASMAGCSKERSQPSSGAALPTLSIVNAKVWTGEPAQPWAEAVLIDGERITRIGTTAQIRTADAAEVIDAGGRLVVPGFIDTHVHFIDGGFGLASVQLREATSREAFVARIRDFAATAKAGTWIRAATGITRCGAASCRGGSGSTQ